MYQFSYAEVAQESGATSRDRERQALGHAIRLLESAERAGPRSREAAEAIYVTRNLWSILVEDLASSDNDLPSDLRASLISIGLWIMKEADSVRLGKSRSFQGMIDVTTMIRDGLDA